MGKGAPEESGSARPDRRRPRSTLPKGLNSLVIDLEKDLTLSGRTRTPKELRTELDNQLAALQASCDGYDSGNLWEGPRIATIIYTLVNDGHSRTVSLLTQLKMRNLIEFLSYSVPRDPNSLTATTPLCVFQISAEDGHLPRSCYVPVMDDGPVDTPKRLKFRDWWKEPIFENRNGQQLSRMNLTFALRSQDGGSHYDQELPFSPYLELKESGMGFYQEDDWIVLDLKGRQPSGTDIPTNAHLATIRQIAFELQRSLAPHL